MYKNKTQKTTKIHETTKTHTKNIKKNKQTKH